MHKDWKLKVSVDGLGVDQATPEIKPRSSAPKRPTFQRTA
jgi:hypothetical protein